MESSYKASLVVSTVPGNGSGSFATYFMVGTNAKKQGRVDVKLPAKYHSSPLTLQRGISELAAMNYLLIEEEVLSQGRTGNGVLLLGSVRAAREAMQICIMPEAKRKDLLKKSSTTKYVIGTNTPLPEMVRLLDFANPLAKRFGEAKIMVADNQKWINPVTPDHLIHDLEVDGIPLPLIERPDGTKYLISSHCFHQVCKRLNNAPVGECWKLIVAAFRSSVLASDRRTLDQLHRELEVHGANAQLYKNFEHSLLFIVASGKKKYPTIVTAYWDLKE